jgi:hypothetical protein
MVNQKALNDKVTELLVSPPNETNKNRTLCLKERKEYLGALDGMSAHHCQNAFFDIWFGHNPFGIMLAIVGRSDTNEGRMLKESHTYEKCPT